MGGYFREIAETEPSELCSDEKGGKKMYLVFILFVAYAIFSLVIVINAYRRVLSDGMKAASGNDVIEEKNRAPDEESQDSYMKSIIESNIENYNGGAENQIDYK